MKKKSKFPDFPPGRFKKVRLMSRITLFFIFAGVVSASASVHAQYDQQVTLTIHNATIGEVLVALEKQTRIKFIYDRQEVARVGRIDVEVKNLNVIELLGSCLQNTGLTYVVRDEVIIIRPRPVVQQPSGRTAFLIRGRILNYRGEPMPGATVTIQGSTAGVSTDGNGNYRLPLSNVRDVVLEVRYIGMENRIIRLNDITDQAVLRGEKELETRMQETRTEISEVVVTGYQVIDKRMLTSSVATVKAEELDHLGSLTVDQMLQGKAPGLMITNVSAQPGAATKVRVRSSGTFTGSREPLWVIDGIIYENPVEISADQINSLDAVNFIGNAITGLNPDDIEQIDILKDASATAVYGSRAANGVIVIQTKRGKVGRNNLSVSSTFNVTRRPAYSDFNMMTSKERTDFSRELAEKGIVFPTADVRDIGYLAMTGYEDLFIQYQEHRDFALFSSQVRQLEDLNFDWFKELYRTAFNQTHNLNLSGGSDRARYYFSAGYNKQIGTEKNVGVDRLTMRTNLDINLYPTVLIRISLDGSTQKAKYNEGINVFNEAYYTSRGLSAYDEDGDYLYRNIRQDRYKEGYVYEDYYIPYNPVFDMNQSHRVIENKALNLNINLEWEIIKGLKLKSTAAYRLTTNYQETTVGFDSYTARTSRAFVEPMSALQMTEFEKLTQLYYGINPFGGTFSAGNTNQDAMILRNNISFNKVFNTKHVLNADIIHELSSTKYRGATGWKAIGYVQNQGYGFVNLGGIGPTTSEKEIDNVIYRYYDYSKSFENYGYQRAMIESINKSPSIVRSTSNTMSFIGIFTYSYDNRYIFNFNLRNDGSNRFGKYETNRFRPVWSVSGRWNIYRERFMEKYTWMDELALRVSYGVRGAAPNVSPELRLNNYAQTNSKVYPEYTAGVSALPNSGLKWETTKTLDVGLNLSFFRNRLSAVLDYAYDKSTDLLLSRSVSYVNGRGTLMFNSGSKDCHTYELNLRGSVIQTDYLTWSVRMNLTHMKEKILGGTEDTQLNYRQFLDGTIMRKGFPVDGFFAYRYAGLSKTGEPQFGILGSDPVTAVEQFQDAFVYQGNRLPVVYGGFGTDLRYRNFSFTANFTYAAGHKVRLLTLYSNTQSYMPLSHENMNREFLARWREPGDEAHTSIPGISFNAGKGESNLSTNVGGSYTGMELYDFSEVRVARGDYIRWSSATLSYRIPKKGMLQQATISLQASNLAVWALDKELKGQDPEQVRNVGMPVLPSYTLTLSIGF